MTTKAKAKTTKKQLTAAAIDCLRRAFEGESMPVHVVQAATTIVVTETGRIPR